MLARPQPPIAICEPGAAPAFLPAPELLEWLTATFVADGAPLANEDHAHIAFANVGVLWTNVTNVRQGRRVLGQAEFKPPTSSMGKWQRERARAQLTGWFGEAPLDFLITLDAAYAITAADVEFCALVEHELYHCGHVRDTSGELKFTEAGMPVFAMRGHDIEEFVGVIGRYGADATHAAAFVAAAQKPTITAKRIAAACGTCGR